MTDLDWHDICVIILDLYGHCIYFKLSGLIAIVIYPTRTKSRRIYMQQQTRIPTISIRANIWITIPIVALIVAILTAKILLLNYVHVFTSMLWTGTDIFMAFLLGPILRNVSLSTRKEVIFWLMPKMIFYMPTVAAVTTTAGYYLASRLGLITLQPPTVEISIDICSLDYCSGNAETMNLQRMFRNPVYLLYQIRIL
jgi:uncharacterized membrane protein